MSYFFDDPDNNCLIDHAFQVLFQGSINLGYCESFKCFVFYGLLALVFVCCMYDNKIVPEDILLKKATADTSVKKVKEYCFSLLKN